MLFFRTISLVTALAFATLSSAVPVGDATAGEVSARDVSEPVPVKRSENIEDFYSTSANGLAEVFVNIQTAVDNNDSGAIPGYLDQIFASISVVVENVNGTVEVAIDVEVDEFANTVYGYTKNIVDCVYAVFTYSSVDYADGINSIGVELSALLEVSLNAATGVESVSIELFASIEDTVKEVGYYEAFSALGIYSSS